MALLSADEVARLIADGENSFVEFKEREVSNNGLVKELCAFSNASGGVVLIGVDDDGVVVGSNGWDDERVMNLSRTSIDPPLIPTYQRTTVEGQTVVVIGVETGTEKPYAATNGETRRYFVRVGTTSREASREELVRLTQASGAVASDLRPVLGALRSDLNDERIAEHLGALRQPFTELNPEEQVGVLRNAEILTTSDEPSVYGLLCFGSNPQKRMLHGAVMCAAYPGSEVARELSDRREVGGTVDIQIQNTVEFIRANLKTESTIDGVHRADKPLPSDAMLREAVSNAVAHRHYGINSPVKVDVFDNRLEVVSPGALPNGVTPAAMQLGVTVRRNQSLVQFLARRGYMDALGRGVVLLYREAERLDLPPPEIQSEEGWVRLRIPLE